jgi:hypothetical protein
MTELRPRPYQRLALLVVAILLLVTPLTISESVASALPCPFPEGWARLESPEHSGLAQDPTRVSPRLYSVAASWESPRVLYAGGTRALHRSDDCGLTWTTVYEPLADSRGLHPGAAVAAFSLGQSGRFYAETGSRWLILSADSGTSWNESRLLRTGNGTGRLALSTSDPNILYVFGSHMLRQLHEVKLAMHGIRSMAVRHGSSVPDWCRAARQLLTGRILQPSISSALVLRCGAMTARPRLSGSAPTTRTRSLSHVTTRETRMAMRR